MWFRPSQLPREPQIQRFAPTDRSGRPPLVSSSSVIRACRLPNTKPVRSAASRLIVRQGALFFGVWPEDRITIMVRRALSAGPHANSSKCRPGVAHPLSPMPDFMGNSARGNIAPYKSASSQINNGQRMCVALPPVTKATGRVKVVAPREHSRPGSSTPRHNSRRAPKSSSP